HLSCLPCLDERSGRPPVAPHWTRDGQGAQGGSSSSSRSGHPFGNGRRRFVERLGDDIDERRTTGHQRLLQRRLELGRILNAPAPETIGSSDRRMVNTREVDIVEAPAKSGSDRKSVV